MSRRILVVALMVPILGVLPGCVPSSPSATVAAPEPDTLDAWLAWAKKQHHKKTADQLIVEFGKPDPSNVDRRDRDRKIGSITYPTNKTLRDAVTGKTTTYTKMRFRFNSWDEYVEEVLLSE